MNLGASEQQQDFEDQCFHATKIVKILDPQDDESDEQRTFQLPSDFPAIKSITENFVLTGGLLSPRPPPADEIVHSLPTTEDGVLYQMVFETLTVEKVMGLEGVRIKQAYNHLERTALSGMCSLLAWLITNNKIDEGVVYIWGGLTRSRFPRKRCHGMDQLDPIDLIYPGWEEDVVLTG